MVLEPFNNDFLLASSSCPLIQLLVTYQAVDFQCMVADKFDKVSDHYKAQVGVTLVEPLYLSPTPPLPTQLFATYQAVDFHHTVVGKSDKVSDHYKAHGA